MSKRKLTENERAATFIGWEPCELCLRHEHFAMHEGAPDMSQPENYMRALGSIRNDFSLRKQNQTAWQCEIYIPSYQYDRWGHTAGEAIVSALAAIYDAEHQEKP